MEAINCETASSYASYLATYIASPLKIEKLVLMEFSKAPPLHKIAEMRYQVEQQRKRFDKQLYVPAHEVPSLGRDYRMPGIVRAKPKPRVVPLAPPTANAVIDSVAADCGVPRADIVSRRRSMECVDARAVVVNVLLARGYGVGQVALRVGPFATSTIKSLRDNLGTYLARNPVARASYDRHMAAISEVVA